MSLNPWQLFLISIAGWMNRKQGDGIDYLNEENRVLRELLGGKRPRLHDDQRRRLAVKGRALGRKLLASCCCIVTPKGLENPGRPGQCRAHSLRDNNQAHPQEPWHRAGTRAIQEDHLERVHSPALGFARRLRFLHGRGLDAFWPAQARCLLRDRVVNAAR